MRGAIKTRRSGEGNKTMICQVEKRYENLKAKFKRLNDELDAMEAKLYKTHNELGVIKADKDKLKADLEAAEKENAILNQTLKLMATAAQKDSCPDEYDCVDEGDCVLHEDAGEQDCIRCWLDYFRAEAEKGE
jgi:chromosome segregation ATPase